MSAGAGYDLSVTTFSPDGRVFQVEYAEKAADKSATVIGIKCVDGVVMGVEKTITSKLLVNDSNRRIFPLGTYSALAITGLVPDGRALANDSREKVREYKEHFGIEISPEELARKIAGRVHNTTIYWQERPYGINSVLSAYDDVSGPKLFLIRPTGELLGYNAIAVGKARQGARTELEKIDFKTITCKTAVELIAMIMHKLHDDVRDKPFDLEITWQCAETAYKVAQVPPALIESAVKAAVEAKQHALMADSDDEE